MEQGGLRELQGLQSLHVAEEVMKNSDPCFKTAVCMASALRDDSESGGDAGASVGNVIDQIVVSVKLSTLFENYVLFFIQKKLWQKCYI